MWKKLNGIFNSKKTITGNKGCVLVVEDNPLDRQFFCQTLRSECFEAIIADGGDIIETAKNTQLIIVSTIPSSRERLDLCAKVRASDKTKHIPILIVADKGDNSNVMEYYSQRVDSYLRKPITKKELIRQVEILVNSKKV